MWKKVSVFALAMIASGLALAPNAKAGDEMVVPDETPAPRYSAPRERIYYSPPVVGISVYPTFAYSAWPYPYGYYRPYYHRFHGGHRYYGHHRTYGHRAYGRGYHRR
jgi:hypothetical protein